MPPIARRSASLPRRFGRRYLLGLLIAALLVVAAILLVPVVVAAGQHLGVAGVIINPCTGERIALRERPQFLPHVASNRGGSREASVNAVGLSGLGSRGTYYLPLGTGKAVITFANGAVELAAGGDLELIGRGNQSRDFLFRGMAHLRMSPADGLRGSGVLAQARCG